MKIINIKLSQIILTSIILLSLSNNSYQIKTEKPTPITNKSTNNLIKTTTNKSTNTINNKLIKIGLITNKNEIICILN